MTAAAPRGLGRATAIQAAGTALSRITGFGRLFAMAYALGKSDLAGTYVIANNTPNILFELILGGVLSGMVLPEFVRQLRGRGSEDETEERAGWDAVSAVICISLVACGVLAALFVVVAPWFIRLYTMRNPGELGAGQLEVATTLLRLFAPQVFFYGTVYLSTAVLRAQRRFAAPMFAPVLNNLVVIAMFLAWPAVIGTRSLEEVRDNPTALYLLGLGTTAGVAAMAFAQLPLRTIARHIRWVWMPGHPAVRRILRLGGWTAGFVAANQLALFVVYFLANGDPADVAAYFYAYTIFLLPHGVVSVSIISTLQPELSEKWASSDRPGFAADISVGLRSIWVVMFPAAAGYALLAHPLVSALLEHGALGATGAGDVARTLVFFAIGLPAFSSWMFLTASYQAMQNTKALFFLYLIENAVNITAALVLYPLLGVEGLALAFSIAYACGTAAALIHLHRSAGQLDGRGLIASAARIAGATATMAVVVAVIVLIAGSSRGSAAVLTTAAGTIAGVTVFFGAARALRVGELTDLLPANIRSRAGSSGR